MEVAASKNPDSMEPQPETPSTSGLFENLSTEDLNQRAMPGSLINGSVNNAADSPFSRPAAFGNNRFFNRNSYSGNIGAAFGNSGLDARPYSLIGQNGRKSAYSNYATSLNLGGLLPIFHSVFNKPSFFVTTHPLAAF
jgi:hypothetical protein